MPTEVENLLARVGRILSRDYLPNTDLAHPTGGAHPFTDSLVRMTLTSDQQAALAPRSRGAIIPRAPVAPTTTAVVCDVPTQTINTAVRRASRIADRLNERVIDWGDRQTYGDSPHTRSVVMDNHQYLSHAALGTAIQQALSTNSFGWMATRS